MIHVVPTKHLYFNEDSRKKLSSDVCLVLYSKEREKGISSFILCDKKDWRQTHF